MKHDPKTGHTSVTNLTTVAVKSAARVHELLGRASKNRAVNATLMNDRSSRSHSVFQLHIKVVEESVGHVLLSLILML